MKSQIVSPTVMFQQYECEVEMERYSKPTNIALVLYAAPGNVNAYPGERIATASCNHPALSHNEVAIKNYSENEGILDTLIAANILNPPHRSILSGFVSIPVCTLTSDYRREYT